MFLVEHLILILPLLGDNVVSNDYNNSVYMFIDLYKKHPPYIHHSIDLPSFQSILVTKALLLYISFPRRKAILLWI